MPKPEDMPKGSKRKSKDKGRYKVAFNEFRFVRIELTEKEKHEFREMYAGGEFDLGILDRWTARGLKISIVEDERGGGVLCSVSGIYSDSDGAGLVLTGRGSDAATAVAVCAYKDEYLCGDGGWGAAEHLRGGSYSDIG